MTQGPKKWHIGPTLWKVKLKRLSSQKKRMVGLKDLKPKIHKGASFKSPWNKGKKENGPARQDQRTKESPVERTRPEIPRTCSTAKVGLRQLKRGTKKHKKPRTDMSFSKNQRAWRATTHEQKAGTSGNPKRLRRSSWENLWLGRKGFGSLRENNKKER